MSMFQRAQNLLTWPPATVGQTAHPISLTAEEGTWIKLADFEGQLNVIFVVFDSLTDSTTEKWLGDWSRRAAQFDSLDTAIFGIHTARTEELRRFKHRLGLEFHLLYDPLAIESRAMRCSSRLAPICKNTVVVVSKNGLNIFSERGQVDPSEVLALIAGIEGKNAEPLTATNTPEPAETTGRGVAPAAVQMVDSEKAETLLAETDGGYLLVDVRTLSEYEADHSPQAIHIPIDELPHRYRELDQTNRIICICQAGGRSAAAAEFLTSIGGSEIFNIEGGMSAWSGERVTGGLLQS
jgi:rhodanese-related sulfurtransferase/peroxiredoxin